MANYNGNLPADNDFIADGPGRIRENQEALRTGQIVDAGSVKGLVPGNAGGQIPVSNGKVNINLNAEKLQNKTPADFAEANHVHPVATTSSNGMLSNTDKAKLDSMAFGAQANQNAFSNVLVGSTKIQAHNQTDVLELIAGPNIALIPDVANERITIAASGKIPSASRSDYAVAASDADTVDGKHASDFVSANFVGQVNGDSTNVPCLRFHIPEVNDTDIRMSADGTIKIMQPGNEKQYKNLSAGTMYSNNKQVATVDQIPTFFPATGGNADSVDGVHFSLGPNPNCNAGIWFDTTNQLIKYWNGSEWRAFGAIALG